MRSSPTKHPLDSSPSTSTSGARCKASSASETRPCAAHNGASTVRSVRSRSRRFIAAKGYRRPDSEPRGYPPFPLDAESSPNGLGSPVAASTTCWCHPYDGGRAFYTAIGHSASAYSEPLVLAHILGGIEETAGVAKFSCDPDG